MKVRIDLNHCQGHGPCVTVAPGVFVVGVDSRAHLLVVDGEVATDMVGAVEDAIAMCPEAALSWARSTPQSESEM